MILSPLQCAYLLNRERGACHVYLEFQGSEASYDDLKKAWISLFQVHPILKGKIDEYGTIDIPGDESADSAKASFHVIEGDMPDIQLRERTKARIIPMDKEGLCHLYVGKTCEGQTWIAFELDLIQCDVLSFLILLRDLARLYKGEEIKTDCVFFKEQKTDKETRKRDREYWEKRLGDAIPSDWEGVSVNAVYDSQERFIPNETVKELEKTASKYDCTLDELLLLEFCKALMEYNEVGEMLVNVPLFERDSDMYGSVGDYTGSMIFRAEYKEDHEKYIKTNLQSYKEDLKHSMMDGLETQRILKQKNRNTYPVPIVFSPSIQVSFPAAECEEVFGEMTYYISQTPGVKVDAQAYLNDKGLYLKWVYIKEDTHDDDIKRMMDAYRQRLLLAANNT